MIASVTELTKQSGFVFEGTVRRTGEAPPGGDETPQTAIVHVERILKGPEVLSRFEGHEVTIVLREHEAVHAKSAGHLFHEWVSLWRGPDGAGGRTSRWRRARHESGDIRGHGVRRKTMNSSNACAKLVSVVSGS